MDYTIKNKMIHLFLMVYNINVAIVTNLTMLGSSEIPSIKDMLRISSHGDAAWRQIYEQIKTNLSLGILKTGDGVPAERELAEHLGVARGTIKRCYDQLRIEGILAGRGRGGSVLQQPKLNMPVLGQLKGFTQEMRELGKTASTQIATKEIIADRAMTSLFGQNSQSELFHLVRIRLADDVPMTRENAWYNLSHCPALAHWAGMGSAYEFLSRECGIKFGRAMQTVEAVLSSFDESAAFGFRSPQPCLLFKRKVYSDNNVLIEYVEGCFRGDLYSYQMPLQI